MTSLALEFAKNANTTHHPATSSKYCYALKNNSLVHYDDIDGGVPEIFGLNCLGWAVNIEHHIYYSLHALFITLWTILRFENRSDLS
jgi:hypothetical protein